MNVIPVSTMKECTITSEKLKDKLENCIQKYQNEMTFHNTEASLSWIIRGCIDYFDKLDTHFLGDGNKPGIPEMVADYFANNIYRLNNALDYLSHLWKIEFSKPNENNLLLDIRTLIVHSGEQITNIKSFELADYKDCQLGRIIVCGNNHILNKKEFSDYDYCLEIWCDKHDRLKNKHLSEVDYGIKNESFKDIYIYLKAKDVKNIILSMVDDFLEICDKFDIRNERTHQLPNIKEKVIIPTENKIDFDKIAKFVSKDLRGGYLIENGLEHWNGFGLQRLYEYVKKRSNISGGVQTKIIDMIENVISNYWEDYKNDTIPDNELPSLDIRDVFSEFLPKYENKGYLEGEKLFYKIAPYFNTKDRFDETDIDYLARFIESISKALKIQINLEQTVDNLICDYFVESVKKQISMIVDNNLSNKNDSI